MACESGMTVALEDELLEPDEGTDSSTSGLPARAASLTLIGTASVLALTALTGSARAIGSSCSSSEESARSKVTRFFLRTGEPSPRGREASAATGFGARGAGEADPSGDDGTTDFRLADGRGFEISTVISTLRCRLREGEAFCIGPNRVNHDAETGQG